MTTIAVTDAYAAIRTRAVAQITTLPIYWPDEDNQLPDTPAPFVFFELTLEGSRVIEIGGGRGSNRHRNSGEINAYVFAPRGAGLTYLLSIAEPVAAAFRGYRASGITINTASVHPLGEGEALVPPGLESAAGAYGCVVVNMPIYFDQKA